MAGELQFDYTSGRTCYVQVRNAVGQIWNGSAFENYQTANIATYNIAASEQGTASGYYTATMPAASAGVYNVVGKDRAGGSPAETDKTISTGQIEWDGSAAVSLASRLATSGYTTPPTANQNADALLDRTDGIETGYTPRQTWRIVGAAAAGKSSGHETNSPIYRSITDAKNRITATTDANGNRTAITIDGT